MSFRISVLRFGMCPAKSGLGAGGKYRRVNAGDDRLEIAELIVYSLHRRDVFRLLDEPTADG